MERIELISEEFDDFLMDARIVGEGTESTVLEYEDLVVKILLPHALNFFTKRKLAELAVRDDLREYMTLPVKEFYIDFKYTGFLMEHAGISIKDLLLLSELSIDERIELLHKIRVCLKRINDEGMVHGDIQFSNIMYDNGVVKISDINNVKFGRYRAMYLNAIANHLCSRYGKTYLLDLHAFNYFSYILLNLDGDDLRSYVQLGADSFRVFLYNKDYKKIKNNHFDEDVCEEQLDLLMHPKSKKLALEKSKYLIDYIK